MKNKVWLYWTLWTVNWGTLAQTWILVMDGKIQQWLHISRACLGEQLVQKWRQGQTSVSLPHTSSVPVRSAVRLEKEPLTGLQPHWPQKHQLQTLKISTRTRTLHHPRRILLYNNDLSSISDQRSCSCCYWSRAAFTNLYIYLQSHLCLKRGINPSGIRSACLHYCLGNTS